MADSCRIRWRSTTRTWETCAELRGPAVIGCATAVRRFLASGPGRRHRHHLQPPGGARTGPRRSLTSSTGPDVVLVRLLRDDPQVPRLVDPMTRVRTSFLAAVAEFHADADFPVPWFVTAVPATALTDESGFTAYVRRLSAERQEDTPRPAGFVPMTTLWWVEDDQFLGRLAIRHRLTPALERAGGHIGYDVRPSARRRGHARAMLAAALPVANALGIDEALLTCDETNVASRRVIEGNGGRYIDTIGGKRRYWVPALA